MQTFSIARAIGYQLFIGAPKSALEKIQKKGLPTILDEWELEKTSKLGIWILGNKYPEATRSLRDTLDLLYGVQAIKLIKENFVNTEGDAPRFGWVKKKGVVSSLLFLMASLCQLPYFIMYDLKLVDFPVFSKIAKEMGNYRLFNMPLFMLLRIKPKEFFVSLASAASSIEDVIEKYGNYKRNKGQLENRDQSYLLAKELFSEASIAKHLGNGARIFLCCTGPFFGKSDWFQHVVGVNVMSGIVGGAIK